MVSMLGVYEGSRAALFTDTTVSSATIYTDIYISCLYEPNNDFTVFSTHPLMSVLCMEWNCFMYVPSFFHFSFNGLTGLIGVNFKNLSLLTSGPAFPTSPWSPPGPGGPCLKSHFRYWVLLKLWPRLPKCSIDGGAWTNDLQLVHPAQHPEGETHIVKISVTHMLQFSINTEERKKTSRFSDGQIQKRKWLTAAPRGPAFPGSP